MLATIQKISLIVLSLFPSTLSVAQQNNEYKYVHSSKKIDGEVRNVLTNPKDTVVITQSLKYHSKTKRYFNSTKDGWYTFKYDPSSKKDQILDSKKEVVATTKGFYNLTFPNGVSYELRKLSSKKWIYTYQGKEVVMGEYKNAHGTKFIQITTVDADAPFSNVAFMMSRIYGAEVFVSKKNLTAKLIAAGLGAACLTLLGGSTSTAPQ